MSAANFSKIADRGFARPHHQPCSVAIDTRQAPINRAYLTQVKGIAVAQQALRRTVIGHRGRGANASLHCAFAPRCLAQRAAAELHARSPAMGRRPACTQCGHPLGVLRSIFAHRENGAASTRNPKGEAVCLDN